MTLWDTAGGERFRTLTNNFYRDADGAMLVYSVEDSYTFENLKDWIEDALPYINQDTFEWALIGNKCELNNDVGKERVEARLHQLGPQYLMRSLLRLAKMSCRLSTISFTLFTKIVLQNTLFHLHDHKE